MRGKPRPIPLPDEHIYRRQHDPIERVAEQITDADGKIGNPWRSVSLLARMERDNRIIPEMRAAGERFHALFRLAHFDDLQAADMGRVGGRGADPEHHRGSQAAQDKIGDALDALGGRDSVGGCCAWFVLGCEYSLTQWASREGWRGRPMQTHVATGVLINDLGVLAKHFGYD